MYIYPHQKVQVLNVRELHTTTGLRSVASAWMRLPRTVWDAGDNIKRQQTAVWRRNLRYQSDQRPLILQTMRCMNFPMLGARKSLEQTSSPPYWLVTNCKLEVLTAFVRQRF